MNLIKSIFLISIVLLILNIAYAPSLSPALSMNIQNNPINAFLGTDGYIYVFLKNVGNDYAEDVKVSVVDFDPGIIIPAYSEVKIGSLSPGDSTTVLLKYSIPNNIPSGIYRVKVKAEYCQQNSCKDIYQYFLINVQNPSAIRIKRVFPTEVKVGEKNTLYLTISNEGNSDVYNVIVTIRDPNGNLLTLGSDNKFYIQKISAKEEKLITFDFSVSSSAQPGTYPLYANFEYTDATNSRIITNSSFGIRIVENVDFFLSLQEISGNLATFTIGNTGLSTAYSVSVEVPPQRNFYSNDGAIFIGNINPGDYTSFSLNIYPYVKVNETRENVGNNTLLLNIYYTNENGERVKIEKSVKIIFGFEQIQSYLYPRFSQRSQNQTLLNYANYFIAVIVLISLILILRRFRKGKKK